MSYTASAILVISRHSSGGRALFSWYWSLISFNLVQMVANNSARAQSFTSFCYAVYLIKYGYHRSNNYCLLVYQHPAWFSQPHPLVIEWYNFRSHFSSSQTRMVAVVYNVRLCFYDLLRTPDLIAAFLSKQWVQSRWIWASSLAVHLCRFGLYHCGAANCRSETALFIIQFRNRGSWGTRYCEKYFLFSLGEPINVRVFRWMIPLFVTSRFRSHFIVFVSILPACMISSLYIFKRCDTKKHYDESKPLVCCQIIWPTRWSVDYRRVQQRSDRKNGIAFWIIC